MTRELQSEGGRYQWSGWTVSAAADSDVALGRLTETHEYFHRQLDDTTAFGGLITTVAALAEARPGQRWALTRGRLLAQSDLLHETFAVGMSLLTTQRRLGPVEGYPMYDRYAGILEELVGNDTHPWVALAALRSAATACMQSTALQSAVADGLEHFDPTQLGRAERPNHRLVLLLAAGFADAVGAERQALEEKHGHESWWRGAPGVTLTIESMDGQAAALSQALERRLLQCATDALRARGAGVVRQHAHHDDLRVLLARAGELVPAGLVRIGALVEASGQDLMHGGALDSQTITLTAAPSRGVVLPDDSVSG